MIIKFIKNKSSEDQYEIENLSIDQEYEVIGIEADDYRIVDNDNEPCLFPPDCFEIIDETKPKFWVTKIGEDGERYSYPPNWNKVDFFEDYFNDLKEVKEQFWREYKELYYNRNS